MPGPYPLPSLAAVISPTGISYPSFEDTIASLTASYQGIFGSDVYLGPDSQDGQKIALEAQTIYDLNQALAEAYLAYSPATAVGVGLSSIVRINGLQRLSPTNSSADLTIVGQAFKQIVSGLVEDGARNQWALPSLVTIPVAGQIVVTAVCQIPGAINAAPGTIDQIVNVQPGWQSASNAAAAVPGNPVEQDSALRIRQAASTGAPAQTPRQAIQAAIAAVPGVISCLVYQNDGDAPDINGIPGHSIAAVVYGGSAAAIAAAIALKKSEGCGTFGTVSEVVLDSQGVPDTIHFFPLTVVPIYVSITIQPFSAFVASTENLLTAAVAAAISGLGIGVDVYFARLWAPAGLTGDAAVASSGLTQAQLDQLSATYVVRSIAIGISTNPTLSNDVEIAFYAAANCVAANVSLTVLPGLTS